MYAPRTVKFNIFGLGKTFSTEVRIREQHEFDFSYLNNFFSRILREQKVHSFILVSFLFPFPQKIKYFPHLKVIYPNYPVIEYK